MARRLAFELLPFAVCVAMISLAPHVKVEESFNAQLMHDLIFGGGIARRSASSPPEAASSSSFLGGGDGGLASFDHHAFPGVVPRTSLGAFVVAAIAAPFARAFDASTAQPDTRLHGLVACRVVIAALFCASLVYFARGLTALQNKLLNPLFKGGGKGAAKKTASADASSIDAKRPPLSEPGTWLLVLASFCCFHLMYYGSRPLPNTFAAILVTTAGGAILRGRHYAAISLLAVAAAVFRSDVAVLGLPLCAALAAFGYVNVVAGFVVGVSWALVAVAASVAIDSVMWGHAVWPEGTVLYYNTILNKSGDWGVMAWHWYFSSALPRAMLFALPLAMVAVAWPTKNTRGPTIVRRLACVYLCFVALYSYLPHKELRFILIALPFLLASAAVLASRLWTAPTSWPVWARVLCRLGLMVGLTASCAVSGVMLRSNANEYVGARALAAAHGYLSAEATKTSEGGASFSSATGARVFLDAYACMNGVTRFEKRVARGGSPLVVTYSKDPTLFNRTAHEAAGTSPAAAVRKFDVLIVREEDVNWLTAASVAKPGNGDAATLQIVAHVPKIGVSIRVPRSAQDVRALLASPWSLVSYTPVPFLTVLAVARDTATK